MDRSGHGTGGPDKDRRGRAGERGAEPNLSGLAGLGVQFVVVILAFLFAGKWLDSRLGTSPWLLILGVFVGAAASMYGMYRKVFPPEAPKPPAGKGPA
jgi:F0F1-type ATP synthase assembly protein I